MCLAIPGKIVEIVDSANHIAKVDVSGVRRNVNIALLDDVCVGDYVLIHVGFAMSKVDEEEAERTHRLLEEIGELQQQMEEMQVQPGTI